MLEYAQQATVLVTLDNRHGSGFLVDASGVLLTARHVIGQNERVGVQFHDGTKVEAKALLSHATLDYAFLQVPPRPQSLSFADPDGVSIGQPVYAIGSPRDRNLAGSVTRGIVSTLNRVQGGVRYLQTDAAITGGNSGGPLLSEEGLVVGINVWGRSDAGGINFALPTSSLAAPLASVLRQLAESRSRIYCAECGFSNSADNCFVLTSVLCCGRCGVVIRERRRPGDGR